MDKSRPAPLPVLHAIASTDRRIARQLVDGDRWTAELAGGNAMLFFLLVRFGRQPGVTVAQLNALARLPRVDLLAALGCDASASTERFLRRMAYHDLDAEAEQVLRALVRQPLPPWARHSRRPHLGLLSRVRSERRAAATHTLDAVMEHDPQARNRRGEFPGVEELAGYWGKPYVRRVIEEITETLRLVDFGGPWVRNEPGQAAICATLVQHLERCRTLEDIQRVHQRVIEVNGHLWTESSDSELENRPWPDPPIPGNDNIEPITSLAELRCESKLMHHCVATYAQRIIEGHGYVYRVHRPERATLYVGKDGMGGWCARELRGACNRQVCRETHDTVGRWLRAQPTKVAGTSAGAAP